MICISRQLPSFLPALYPSERHCDHFLASLLQIPIIARRVLPFPLNLSISLIPHRPLAEYCIHTYIGGCMVPLSKMGFHFDAQDDVGLARSKNPKVQGQSYNYHGFLYSLSSKESPHEPGHQSRLSLAAKNRLPIPPRQSSLPVLNPSSLRQEIYRTPPSAGHPVSSMDSVLPLQLRAGVKAGGFDFSSWIESTIEEVRHPFIGNNPAHKSHSPSLADVSWMQEEQDTAFCRDRPLKYRETAAYADPGSAVVSFPYCGCEGLGSSQYHRHGLSGSGEIDSVRPPSPLFSKDSSPRCSGDTLVDLSASHPGAGGPQTLGRVRCSSSQSNLSQKPQEERASEAARIKPLPSPSSNIGIPRIGNIISPTVFSPSTSEECPSMPCTPGLVLDVSFPPNSL